MVVSVTVAPPAAAWFAAHCASPAAHCSSPSAKAAFFRAHLWQKGDLAAASATAFTASGPAATMAWVAARRTDSRSETNASCEQGRLTETQSGKRHREVIVGTHLQDGQGLGAEGGEVVARRCGPHAQLLIER